jgi:hypothetical protein
LPYAQASGDLLIGQQPKHRRITNEPLGLKLVEARARDGVVAHGAERRCLVRVELLTSPAVAPSELLMPGKQLE